MRAGVGEQNVPLQNKFKFICAKIMGWWKWLVWQLCSVSLFLYVLLWQNDSGLAAAQIAKKQASNTDIYHQI